MEITITAKFKIKPTIEQQSLLCDTVRAYQKGCNFVSELVYQTKDLAQLKLHKLTYEILRRDYALRSQMAQSVIKTVISCYKSLLSIGSNWTNVQFKKPVYDLVWNRDYSLTKDHFSINTLQGRIKVPFETKGLERYFEGEWLFGTAKLVMKYGKFFLHIPMTKIVELVSEKKINQIVGVDMGINFVAVSYDSKGKSLFFKGRPIKDKRAHYKHLRKQLQQRQTSSARRRLQAIGQRETRWMADINHTVSKALVTRYGANTLFVIEELSGVRQATERVRTKDRYQSVSWAFYQLRQMLEYKALLQGAKVITVDPRFTSQSCPKCGHTERANRNKKKHTFSCKNCSYTSNDDRIGAMNLQRKGIEYIVEATVQA
ncbi:RNA-guided endonuclease InsQ/TnpB family protein [Brevibacillus centrosporus]|uniref:Transposase, IS605 OrfB family, central region n=1 Tax=Brevibacillus centrosporus TaxID=54910 RepID=A0A1I3UMF7_9BACL|nr:RNA-guided endonuclease TnpB family protein [Brevibacillus centrosporus]MEC2130501.1 transposase [Brevibacillus centrosporus]MED4911350.1 transposase [Brevibacillus centrosporus]RNB68897.1 transposase [Brevibacillus centrosporus]SFJ83919.1 transposase, IS605 OrfB family, central region [Brevibacillus centrosporus]GED32749.1 transposase [Brevibacillus centrosporus]